MLARQRQSLIVQELVRAGSAKVSDLTRFLGVSDMTVRRDLDVLAQAGLIEKVHGGAVLPGAASSHEPGFEAKSAREQEAKQAMARVAAGLVTPGTAVALSAGTTTFALARLLREVAGLTIVTNSVRVASLFWESAQGAPAAPGTSVVLTGGIRTPSDALVGPVADLGIRSLHVDELFLGCHGIDAAAGLTTPNLAESETNRAFIQAARRVTVLADHTKWGVVALSSFADLQEVDTLVSDGELAPHAREVTAERVGRLLIAAQ